VGDMETHRDLLDSRTGSEGFFVSRVHSWGNMRIAFFQGRTHTTALQSVGGMNGNHVGQIRRFAH
jgi:hypothetical protein